MTDLARRVVDGPAPAHPAPTRTAASYRPPDGRAGAGFLAPSKAASDLRATSALAGRPRRSDPVCHEPRLRQADQFKHRLRLAPDELTEAASLIASLEGGAAGDWVGAEPPREVVAAVTAGMVARARRRSA